MGNDGLLRSLRTIYTEVQSAKSEMQTNRGRWAWKAAPIIFPESYCPYCHSVIRSTGIWYLGGAPLYNYLVGAMFPPDWKLVMPNHPHHTGNGKLCLGKNTANGIELLSSAANLDDCPMGNYRVPTWLARYWGHKCEEGRVRIKEICDIHGIASSYKEYMDVCSTL